MRMCFVLLESADEVRPLLVLGPWDELDEARQAVKDALLLPGDRWFIVKPLEMGEVERGG